MIVELFLYMRDEINDKRGKRTNVLKMGPYRLVKPDILPTVYSSVLPYGLDMQSYPILLPVCTKKTNQLDCLYHSVHYVQYMLNFLSYIKQTLAPDADTPFNGDGNTTTPPILQRRWQHNPMVPPSLQGGQQPHQILLPLSQRTHLIDECSRSL